MSNWQSVGKYVPDFFGPNFSEKNEIHSLSRTRMVFGVFILPEELCVGPFKLNLVFALQSINFDFDWKTSWLIDSISMLSHMMSDNFLDWIWVLSYKDKPFSFLLPSSLWVKKNLSPFNKYLNCFAKIHPNVGPVIRNLKHLSFLSMNFQVIHSW